MELPILLETFAACFSIDLTAGDIIKLLPVLFAFLFVDFFDTLGTLVGVASRSGIADKNGNFPNMNKALMSDAVATSVGAVFGTSTVTTFVESTTGIASGGRTGLTAVTVAVLFLISIFFASVFVSIPAFAIAPSLIYVGFLMFLDIQKLPFQDDKLFELIPAFICVLAMPLFYSISEGISWGIIVSVFAIVVFKFS